MDSSTPLISAIMAPRTSCFCAVLACRALRWDGPLCGASGRWPSPTSPVTPLQPHRLTATSERHPHPHRHITPHQRRRSLDERGVRVGQPVRQVVGLQKPLPGRAIGLAAVAHAQVQACRSRARRFQTPPRGSGGPLAPIRPGLPRLANGRPVAHRRG